MLFSYDTSTSVLWLNSSSSWERAALIMAATATRTSRILLIIYFIDVTLMNKGFSWMRTSNSAQPRSGPSGKYTTYQSIGFSCIQQRARWVQAQRTTCFRPNPFIIKPSVSTCILDLKTEKETSCSYPYPVFFRGTPQAYSIDFTWNSSFQQVFLSCSLVFISWYMN